VSRLEARVGEACREAAETVRPEAVRDLRLDPAHQAMGVQGGARGRNRLLGPLAAAASVVMIAVGALVIVPRLGSPPHHPGKTRHKIAGLPRALATLPKYTVLNMDGSYLQVVATATGKIVGTLPHPPNQAFAIVTGTADDRWFFVASDLNPQTSCQTYLSKFDLSASGQPSALTRLSVAHLTGEPTALAATADGSRVAFSVEQCSSGPRRTVPNRYVIGTIGLIDLATGKITKKWSYTLGESYPTDLSMSASGKMLGYSNYFNASTVGRLLATSSPAGPSGSYSRIVVLRPANTAVSADGRLLYAITGTQLPYGRLVAKPQLLAAYDMNGRRVRVLRQWSAATQLGPLFADPAGGYALLPVQNGRPRLRVGPCFRFHVREKAKCENLTFRLTKFLAVNLGTGAVTPLPISSRLFRILSWGVAAW